MAADPKKPTEPPGPEVLARARAKSLADLYWHLGTFVIINAFLWIIDLMGGDGANWAYWVTLTWGIGLAFHVLAYLIDGRQMVERRARSYLDEDSRHT